RGTSPTTSDGVNPSASARCRSNTTRSALASMVTNANLSSGETATSTAPLPNGLVSVPTIGLTPCSALATSSTSAPLLAATSRNFPLLVSCSLPVAPGAGSTWSSVGASEEPWLSTATWFCSVTKLNLPSAVVTTPNGWLPTWT